MILIVTNWSDQTADWLILELQRRRTPYLRFNTEDYPDLTSLVWSSDGEACLRWPDRTLDLGTVSAVWYRRPLPPSVASWRSPEQARWAAGESRAAIDGVWRTLDALWVNHPDDNRIASSKLHQLRRATELGFRVPSTVVTNTPDDLRSFAAGRGNSMICKPIDDGLLELQGEERVFFTSRFALNPEDDLTDLGPEPYLFQELVPKAYDVRVTVIGAEVFATRIESQATVDGHIDWRIAGSRAAHQPEELPSAISDLCLKLTRSYDLQFGAIDLACTTDGEYVFFEINPNGQWAWVEQLTRQPLRASMANLLEAGKP
jgi:hypothetical protein